MLSAPVLAVGVALYGDRSWDIDGNVTYSYAALPSAAQCSTAATNLTAHLASYNSTILNLLASQRLGDLRTTGKFAQRLNVANTMRGFLNSVYPELVRAIYIDSTGADPSDPAAASLDALTSLFVDSSLHLVTGAPASLALYRRRLTGVSVSAWRPMCQPAPAAGRGSSRAWGVHVMGGGAWWEWLRRAKGQ